MSLTFLGWLLIVSSIVIPALCFFSRGEQLPLDIAARLRPRRPNDPGSGAATPGLAARRSYWAWGRDFRGRVKVLLVPAAVFLAVSGIGAATTSYLGNAPEAMGSEDTDDGVLQRLETYARSAGAEKPAPKAAGSEMLPDVETMIDRLAARLETAPEDIQGWRMLGWSYFNTGRYEQAAAAYAKAAALDPSSADLKSSYEEAKTKASESANSDAASSTQPDSVGKAGDGTDIESVAKSESAPPHENSAAIRSMVEGLADRLERSPRDVEGWARLMRSRVVLGERDVATTAFHKALDIFKDDSDATSRITAAAIELGLKAD